MKTALDRLNDATDRLIEKQDARIAALETANKELVETLKVCENKIEYACEVGDTEWSVYSGFKEARSAIRAAIEKYEVTK